MPPRHAYWTILLDGQATAFRAADREELLPTFNRLKEKHPETVMKWFERGKLWDSREDARTALGGGFEVWGRGTLVPPRRRPAAPDENDASDAPPRADGPREPRDPGWRPGGTHRDPREKYELAKKAKWKRFKDQKRAHWEAKNEKRAARPPQGDVPDAPPRGDDRRQGDGGERRPWGGKPSTGERKPWGGGHPATGERRPWGGKPGGSFKDRDRSGERPPRSIDRDDRGDTRGFRGPAEGASRGGWSDRPPRRDDRQGDGGERRPWGGKPSTGERKPWGDKPMTGERRPWGGKPGGSFKDRDRSGDRPPRSGDRDDRGDTRGFRGPAEGASRGGWSDRPPRRDDRQEEGGERRPWGGKPSTGERKPWGGGKPASGERRPWSGKPSTGERRPWGGKPSGGFGGGDGSARGDSRARESRGDDRGGQRPPSARPPSGRTPSTRSPFTTDRPPSSRPPTGRPPSGRPPGAGGGASFGGKRSGPWKPSGVPKGDRRPAGPGRGRPPGSSSDRKPPKGRGGR